MTNNIAITTDVINNSLLLMCDNKNKRKFLIKRLSLGVGVPCFVFVSTPDKKSLKKSMVSIASYDSHTDRFIGDNGLSYDKVVYLGFMGECNSRNNLAALAFTTAQQPNMGAGVTCSAYNESLDDFDILQHASASPTAVPAVGATAHNTCIGSLSSFKDFMMVYENLPLMVRSINDFNNNELEWFYYSTIGTDLADLTVSELLTNGRIINIVETCDKLSCSVDELKQSIRESVKDESKCIWSVTDASDWNNCNFVLVYLN